MSRWWPAMDSLSFLILRGSNYRYGMVIILVSSVEYSSAVFFWTKRQPGLLFIAIRREYKMYGVSQRSTIKERDERKLKTKS
jgi:hypothetical protein